MSENQDFGLDDNTWTNLDDFILVKGIFTHGYDNWKEIVEDRSLWGYTNSIIEVYKLLFKKIEKEVIEGFNEEKVKK